MGNLNLKKKKSNFLTAFDPDSMPEDADPAIWHLTLHFEQEGESYGIGSAGRVKIYALLNRRIEASGIRSRHFDWQSIIAEMISRFWGHELEVSRSDYAVEDFTKLDVWLYLEEHVITKRDLQQKIDSGTKRRVPDPEKKSSRRSNSELQVRAVRNTVFSDDELQKMFDKYRRSC